MKCVTSGEAVPPHMRKMYNNMSTGKNLPLAPKTNATVVHDVDPEFNRALRRRALLWMGSAVLSDKYIRVTSISATVRFGQASTVVRVGCLSHLLLFFARRHWLANNSLKLVLRHGVLADHFLIHGTASAHMEAMSAERIDKNVPHGSKSSD
eukprot:CAMPEP_0194540572 /NCGR_PEP_ID=MMETSP0253-20130528/80818_1 /TAXON_ID=2966 /ORGANISM="Noctiluca scintillans" /LENGTH=151 /DNA_ID=CAMNT_0039386955 /DNA_START=1 /DNA_END=456 /DNA_ORIENTATION=-